MNIQRSLWAFFVLILGGCATSYDHRCKIHEDFITALSYRIHASPFDEELFEFKGNSPTPNRYDRAWEYFDEYNKTAEYNQYRLLYQYKEEYRPILMRKLLRPSNTTIPPQMRGLCLSGGGIRSATYNLGVLQALHETRLLDKFDYLSSISGGGYIAGWYMTHRDDMFLWENESEQIRHVLSNANYLTRRNVSHGKTEFTWSFLVHSFWVPFHWICNGIFDLDWNVGWYTNRDKYREGLRHAFINPDVKEYPLRRDMSESIYSQILAAIEKQNKNKSAESPTPPYVSDLFPGENRNPIVWGKPFWIINAGLSLSDDTGMFRNQFGDNFEITPLHCGSDAVGYVNTDKKHKWMRTDYAMAISGGAISQSDIRAPWYQRETINLLNMDLGYYIDGWGAAWNRKNCDFLSFSNCWNRFVWCVGAFNPFKWIIQANRDIDIGHDRTPKSKRYFLSDGGNFENLAVLAPIRRGCRIIVISDCSHDPSCLKLSDSNTTGSLKKIRALAFSELRRLDMRLMNEYGARLQINLNDFNTSVPVMIGVIKNLPVQTADFDQLTSVSQFDIFKLQWSPHNLGALKHHIQELGDNVVWVIYIKPVFMYDYKYLPISTAYYKAISKEAFPQEPTTDQFYSEEQFTAYRELGYHTIKQYSNVIEAFME
ncbi:MAG: patatin-like phospholipase family protein [Candidatus Sumerlaeia bacterium]